MRYVHRWREANRGMPDREGYVRVERAAGSMQVDFGMAWPGSLARWRRIACGFAAVSEHADSGVAGRERGVSVLA